MARPLRIQYPDAWYHVMNRGLRHSNIYRTKNDFVSFLKLTRKSSIMFFVNIAGYCLMNNHYHILLQTPQANLSRFMRHLDGVYTQQFNRKYNLDGPLFKGRYKSILIENDTHLLQALRYVHRNPIKAGIEKELGNYPWSSYLGYILESKEWEWLYSDFILSMFNGSKSAKKTQYKVFMAEESPEEINEIFGGQKQPPIFGCEIFKIKIKKLFSTGISEAEVPESKILLPEITMIVQTICDYYQISRDELLFSKRGITNEPRHMAIFLIRRLRGEKLMTIADYFHVNKYSSISSIITRFQKRLANDKKLSNKHEDILKLLYEVNDAEMSQAKT